MGHPSSTTSFEYDAKGQLTTVTDPLGHETTLTYTSAGLVGTVTDAQNHATTYEYDARGNRTSIVDALNHQTTFEYDAHNRLTRITYPDQTTAQFAYDARGRRTSVTDGNGRVTQYAYDDADRLTSATDAAGNVTQYGYDTENNLTSITDALGRATSFAYNTRGWVTQTTFPSTLAEIYVYDAVGNLTGKTDRKGQVFSYFYDDLDRLTRKQYQDSTGADYVYDLVGKLQQVTDPTGTYGLAYDNIGRLTGTTTQYSFLPARSFTNSYSYDAASNRAGYTDPQNGTVAYGYDTLNRLTSLNSSLAGQFGFGYDDLSRRTSLTRPNGVNTAYTYDSLSRLLSVLHQAGGVTIDGAGYTLDDAGNRTAKTNYLDSSAEEYAYDAIYQLTQVTRNGTTSEAYSYDEVGNRLSSLNLSPWTFNESNHLLSTPATTFTYDNNGNTLTKADANGTTSYAWDYENRLTTVTLPGEGGVVSFRYDPFGRRVEKSGPSGTTIFVYDGANIVAEYDAAGAVLTRYAQGAGVDEPLAMSRSGALSFYNADGLGSITSLADGSGSLARTYVTDAFGNEISSTGTVANASRYTGREWDAETGLYYYRARYYEPEPGRFASEDSIQFDGESNFYRYAQNDPTGNNDPSGLCKVQMLYSPVTFLGTTVGYHAFLVVSNNSGGPPKPLFFRAGPGSGGSWWTPNLEALAGPYINDPKLNPDWHPSAQSQILLDDQSDCKCIVGRLDDYNRRLNNSHIPYHTTSTNSNAYASGAATAAGLPVPKPPVSVPGWGTPLPVTPK